MILCEALIDALILWCHGFTNVPSAFGIEGFTSDIVAAFKDSRIERILIAYARDEPGERTVRVFAGGGVTSWRVSIPQAV